MSTMRSPPSENVTVSTHSFAVEQASPASAQWANETSPTMKSMTRRAVQTMMKRAGPVNRRGELERTAILGSPRGSFTKRSEPGVRR